MTSLLDRRNLEAAWDRVRGAEGADTPGPDGVTSADVLRHGPQWLTRLIDDLFQRRYRPTPLPFKVGSNRPPACRLYRARVTIRPL